jgi:hypothetical protein
VPHGAKSAEPKSIWREPVPVASNVSSTRPDFAWSTHIKAIVGTELCMHAQIGFLARGHVLIQYGDGCTVEFVPPAVVAIEPRHDGWVVGERRRCWLSSTSSEVPLAGSACLRLTSTSGGFAKRGSPARAPVQSRQKGSGR